MIDIAGLQADPEFKALPPDRQQALLAHARGVQAPSASIGGEVQKLGKAAEQGYEQNIAQPLAKAAESGEEFVGIPEWAAKPIAETVVPQTLTGAGLDVAALALPELKGAEVLGEAAGPLTRLVGSRLGRMATMGGIGAATEAATGGNPWSGAAQGAGGELGAQALRGATGMITRRLALGPMLRKTTADFGDAMTKAMPWLGKVQTTQDFADNFIHGGAYKKALTLLQNAKGGIARRVQGHLFDVPTIMPDGTVQVVGMPFDEADKMLTQLQRRSHLPVGDPRSGAVAADWNHLAHEAREGIAKRLDKIGKGMGEQYLGARRRLDAAITLGGHPDLQRGGVFRSANLFDSEHKAINQPEMIERINKFSTRLQRSLGKDNVDNMLDALRRGAKGEVADIPPKGGEGAHLRAGVGMTGHPHITAHPGRTYKAVGDVPKYYEPPHAPFEAATQGAISALRSGQSQDTSPGPAAQALDTSRAEALAPTPSASDRAMDVTTELRKGKTPEVSKDLNRGRLSLDETNKLIQQASNTDPAAMVQGLPLTEVMDAIEQASPDERKMLMPLVEQRLRKELPQEKNKTLQMKLAQRFQRLQSMPAREKQDVYQA